MPKITLTNEECIEYFYNALCNGVSTIEGYGLVLECDEEEFQETRNKLSESACYEDILIQVLKDGKELKIIDEVEDGEDSEYTRSITLKDVIERVPNTPEQHLIDMMCENDDATTADVILQTVFYNEVIFG